MNNKKGMTLLEAVFSIMIISILALFTIPIIISITYKVNLKSSAYQAASLLRTARDKALATRENCIVEIDPLNEKIVLKQNGQQIYKIWNAPKGIDISDISGNPNPVKITFTPKGTTSNKSIHFIVHGTKINGTSYNPSGSYSTGIPNKPAERVKCFTITTDNVTGRIRVINYGLNTPWGTTLI